MPANWQAQSERGSAASLWLICFIANHLGRQVTRLLLIPITAYYLLTAAEHRSASRRYLHRVLEREPGWFDVARHIHCFASTIVDRIYFVTDRVSQFNIEFSGETVLDKYETADSGCLLLGAHIGSFDALRALAMRRKHLPLKVLMYPNQNALITRLIGELNPEVANAVIPLGGVDTLVQVKGSIERGEVVGMLGDRVAENERTSSYDFLGAKASFPLGPAILSDVLKAPAILCLALYMGGNKYRIVLEELPPVPAGSRTDRDARVSQWTKYYVERLETHLKQAPYNWFNFYDFWNDDGK